MAVSSTPAGGVERQPTVLPRQLRLACTHRGVMSARQFPIASTELASCRHARRPVH